MFEKMRERWTKAINPLVHKMEGVDPSLLTWEDAGGKYKSKFAITYFFNCINHCVGLFMKQFDI